MLPMSKKSKVIRIALIPIWLAIWVIGGLTLVLAHIFDHLWSGMDKARDSFESWVHRIAPLDYPDKPE